MFDAFKRKEMSMKVVLVTVNLFDFHRALVALNYELAQCLLNDPNWGQE